MSLQERLTRIGNPEIASSLSREILREERGADPRGLWPAKPVQMSQVRWTPESSCAMLAGEAGGRSTRAITSPPPVGRQLIDGIGNDPRERMNVCEKKVRHKALLERALVGLGWNPVRLMAYFRAEPDVTPSRVWHAGRF